MPAPRVKTPAQLIAESGADLEGNGLKRTMGLFQLICFGVGAIVGTGIFVGLSDSVAQAGPAVVVSFVLAAITCVFTAFAFAELGGAIPVSGSSYSFAYAGLGEGTAFLVGWCLLLEYGVSVSAVAVGWSQYVNELLASLTGTRLPAALSAGPSDGGIVNLPAVVVIALASVLLVRGVRESARATAVNVAVIALRRREPGLSRTFRVPLYPVVPLLGVGFCLYLMYETGWTTWIQFAAFLAAGSLVYVLYGRRNSRLARTGARAGAETATAPDAAEREPQAV
ncbi:amino acid permease [Streptomyces sp. NPDC086182]|jgi:amino acid transporter|uniref:amino acid permease n=1 Tax=Streptomyces sp. NPDC086182 TaxID=3155058 RepID=UPI0034197CF1